MCSTDRNLKTRADPSSFTVDGSDHNGLIQLVFLWYEVILWSSNQIFFLPVMAGTAYHGLCSLITLVSLIESLALLATTWMIAVSGKINYARTFINLCEILCLCANEMLLALCGGATDM